MASGGAAPAPLPCLEIFDENSQPSVEEISEYAQQIGIDPHSETHLLPLAKDGLMQALPPPWKAYYDEKLKVHYFYNSETSVTQWEHPLDHVYKNLVVKARQASERGDSFLDDTCISIQELLTYEEDPKQIPDGKGNHKFHDDDSSINNSLEEEISSAKNEPKDALLKKMHQNTLKKKSLPSLKPIAGNGDNKLGYLNNLRRNVGESNTFPRTAQVGINKFKNFSYLQKNNCDDSVKSDDLVEPESETSAKNSLPNSNNNRLIKQTSEIIDLSFNPNKRDDSLGDESYKPVVKKGIVLTGGGSVFLKSNRLSQSMSVEGKSEPQMVTRPGPINLGDNPKGILRERSFGEVQLKSPYADKSDGGKPVDIEDDKKSVRFNLEKQDMEIQYDYSPSPSSNSSSDLLLGNNQNSVIQRNKTERHEMFTGRTVARRNSESSITTNEIPNFMKNGKLRPLINNEGGKLGNQQINKDQSEKSAQFGVRTKSEDIPSGSPTRRLIRPNPGDFIKPHLFQKPFEKLSDILKTDSPDSDSESDKPVNNSSPPPTVKRKLSINLMESVDSEASIESPDKDMNVLIDNSHEDKLEYERVVIQNQNPKDRRFSVPTMTMVEEDNSYGNMKNYKNEMTSFKNAEIDTMKHKMEIELKEIKHNLEKGFENELRMLRDKLQIEHIKNKSDLNQAIISAQNINDSNIKEALDRMRFELNIKKERLIHEEEIKHSEELESLAKLLKEEHVKNIKKLEQEKKNQLNTIAANLEKENMKSINDLKMQYNDNLEAEKLRLIADNKSTLDKMKTEHESICDELRKDYRSEVELVRGQQAAHLSALREKMRREREPPRPPAVLSPPSVLSPRDDTSYERLRCDKRLLEDKYRCLKEKYARLKSDVKISIERRNKRREQSLTTGSETEKSHSHHKPAENGDSNVLNKDYLNRGRSHIVVNDSRQKNGNNNEILSPTSKEACQENNNSKIDANVSHSDSAPPQNSNLLMITKRNLNAVSPDCSRGKSPSFRDKSPMGRNRQKSFNGETDNSIGVNDVSLSHSESQTVSNKHKRVNIVENVKENGERIKANVRKFRKDDAGYADTTVTDYHDSSDTGTSEQYHLKESLVGKNRKKLFTRLKSASTSRLNYTVSSKVNDRACSPVENLRQQLRKLEDLEEQFPDVTLNADTTAYRLRYPFPDQGNSGVSGGELGFLRHRALVEREGVRRARAVLRRRADVLRQRRRSPAAWQEECELTDMEVSLHRTKSILGEKVIRLRHIEKSLRRIQDGDEPKDSKTDSNLPKQREADYKDTTLSDISSHSSGFSSTEGHSDNNRNAKHVHSAPDYEHSSEIINSLQTLNTEIRDIWQVLNSQQQMNVAKVIPIGQLLYTDVGWQLPIAASNIPSIQNLPNSVSINVPAINENKFLSYRQASNIGPKTVQAAAPVGVATSLVERTRDLRDWLKQQAAL